MKTSQGLLVLAALLVPLTGQAQVSPEDSRAQFDAQLEQAFRNQRTEMQKNQQRAQRQQQEQPINERLYADVRSLLTSAKDLTKEALNHPDGKRIQGYTSPTLADDLAGLLADKDLRVEQLAIEPVSPIAHSLGHLMSEAWLCEAESSIEALGREAGAGEKTVFYLAHSRAALLAILGKVKAATPEEPHKALCQKAEKELKGMIDDITQAVERYQTSMKTIAAGPK